MFDLSEHSIPEASCVTERDGIRGVAIAMVVLFHCMPASGWALVDRVLVLRASLWGGVDLFFVLSGYLSSGILMNHHTSANQFKTFSCASSNGFDLPCLAQRGAPTEDHAVSLFN